MGVNKKNKSQLRDKLEARKHYMEEEEILSQERRIPKGRPLPPDLPKKIFMQKMDLTMFPDILKHMNNIPGKVPNNMTFEKLMVDLSVNLQTELEIIRTMFLWIIFQDLPLIQTFNFPESIKEDTPMGFFRDIVREKKTIAHLYARLVSEAGIHVKVITGYKKGATWYPDYVFGDKTDPSRGVWNAVFVDGHWRYIDVKSALSPDAFVTREKTWEEFYFLPDPCDFICTHFPDDKLWQLVRPLKITTLEHFQSTVKKWPAYYSCSAKLPSTLPALIQVPKETGSVQIEFNVDVKARSYETYKCVWLTRQGKTANDGTELYRYILHYSVEGKDTVEVFCPKRGDYMLEIYVMDTTYGSNIFNLIAIYQLKCAESVLIFPADVKPQFPKICSYYGLNPLAYKKGIRILSKTNSPEVVIRCNEFGEGRLTIGFDNTVIGPIVPVVEKGKKKDTGPPVMGKVPRGPIEFVQNLYTSIDLFEPERDRVLQTTYVGEERTEVTFMFRVSGEGNFALILYYNDSPANPDYIDFAHFLIAWKKPNSVPPVPDPFPHISKGKVGQYVQNCKSLGVTWSSVYPMDTNSVKESMLFANDCGEVLLIFKHTKPLSFMAEKIDNDVEFCIEVLQNTSYVTIKTAVKAERRTFLLKLYAAEIGQTEKIPQIYQFMMFVMKPTNSSKPLPKCPSYYWGGVQNRLTEFKTKVTGFPSTQAWTDGKFKVKDSSNSKTLPNRIYHGGDDMRVEIAFNGAPFAIKPMLKLLEKGQTLDFDKHCMLQTTNVKGSTVRVRFPKGGMYILALFCAPLDEDTNSQQLIPFYYCMTYADSTSGNTKPFPNTFALWSSCSHHIDGEFNMDDGFFKRNKAAEYKVELFNLIESETKGQYEEIPFHEVVLLVDEKKIITAKTGGIPGFYEWEYTPGDDTKKISIAVIPQQGSDEVLFALSYKVM